MRNIYKYLLTILILFTFYSCFKKADYDTAKRNPNDLFKLSSDHDSIPADGTSQVEILISGLPEEIADTENKIILDADNAIFSNGNNHIELTSSLVYENNLYVRKATTKIKAGTRIATATIKATVKGVTKEKTISFYRALPDRIKINPSAIFYKPSMTTGLPFEVQLIRNTGVPSLETAIGVVVHDSTGKNVGSFQRYDNLSDSNNKTYYTYFFVDTTYKGPLKIIAGVDPTRTPVDSVIITTY